MSRLARKLRVTTSPGLFDGKESRHRAYMPPVPVATVKPPPAARTPTPGPAALVVPGDDLNCHANVLGNQSLGSGD